MSDSKTLAEPTKPALENADKQFIQRYGVRVLTSIEAAWLAGILDGEGSIYISRVKARGKRGFIYMPYLSVGNSNHELIVKVQEVIGRGYAGTKKETRLDWSDMSEYKGSASVLRGILPQVLPHLVIKNQVARKMLEFLNFVETNSPDGLEEFPPGYNETLELLYWRVKELNQRGRDSSMEEVALWTKSYNPNNRRPGNRVRDCRQLSESERAWLAGVIDGEGSVFLSRVFDGAYRRGFFYRPELLVSNSNRQFLIKITSVIGEGTVHRAKKGDDRQRTRWEYVASAGVLRAVLPQTLRYMIVKRERAKKMLEYFEFIDFHRLGGRKPVSPGYYDQLDAIYGELKRLNQKGRNRQS